MKEYKTVEIRVKDVMTLGDQLNDYSKEGWVVNHLVCNDTRYESRFVYLLERKIVENGYYENVSGAIGSQPMKVFHRSQ